MGLEAPCRARFGGKASDGEARLEEKDLYFRGDFRLRIPLKDVRSVEARGGELRVESAQGAALFRLKSRAEAEKWALKIRYPRSLLDKLGVKPGLRVAVLGIGDQAFLEELAGRTADISTGRARSDTDLVFVGISATKDLDRLTRLKTLIKKNGAIWVVWPKGGKGLREDDVRNHGKTIGLVDVKVVSFSDRLSALKMMIPVADR
jgi:hypothetical protein